MSRLSKVSNKGEEGRSRKELYLFSKFDNFSFIFQRQKDSTNHSATKPNQNVSRKRNILDAFTSSSMTNVFVQQDGHAKIHFLLKINHNAKNTSPTKKVGY